MLALRAAGTVGIVGFVALSAAARAPGDGAAGATGDPACPRLAHAAGADEAGPEVPPTPSDRASPVGPVTAPVMPAVTAEARAGDEGYTRTPSTIRFSHAAHKGVDCLRCHAAAQASADAGDNLYPPERTCIACHKREGDRTRPPAEQGCAYCHVGFDPTTAAAPARNDPPQARFRFSHKRHRQLDCASCHAGIAAATGPVQALPRKPDCATCHARQPHLKPIDDPAGCATCHFTTPAGGLAVDRRGTPAVPRSGPLAHTSNFAKNHGLVARTQGASCASCHNERTCQECHNGVMRPLAFHPGDYRALHPIDARARPESCNTCHRAQSFCLDCHTRAGLSARPGVTPPPDGEGRPVSRAQAGLDRAVHPPGFADCRPGPNHHAFVARRQLQTCASCHTGDTCIDCHRGGGPCGTSPGLNPHRHMSPLQLRQLERAAPENCAQCHAGPR